MIESSPRQRAAEVRLERGDSSDLDGVMSVMESAFGRRYGEAWTRSQCAGILPMTGVVLTLAKDGAALPAGFSLVRSVADECELLLLAVHQEHQGKGVGRKLLDHFLECARKQGIARVHLEVRDGNPAIAMYRAAGFNPVGRRRKYYHSPDGRHFDALTFERSL